MDRHDNVEYGDWAKTTHKVIMLSWVSGWRNQYVRGAQNEGTNMAVELSFEERMWIWLSGWRSQCGHCAWSEWTNVDMKFWPDAVFCVWPSRLMCCASTCEIMVGKDASLHVEQSFRLFMSLESSVWWSLYAPLVCSLRLSQQSSPTRWCKATELYSLTVLELRSPDLTVYLTSQALAPHPASRSERTRENSSLPFLA